MILALAGLLGLYVEMTHPGLIAPGVLGAISLILALFAFNMLPVNWAGAALILLAIVLFVLEATVTSHGILAIGGIYSMIAAASCLSRAHSSIARPALDDRGCHVSDRHHHGSARPSCLPVASAQIRNGEEGMMGEAGVAKTDIQKDGKVLVHGEYWNASSMQPIPAGARVRVIKVEGLKVEVEPL